MELALFCLFAGLFLLGLVRFLIFRLRMKKYNQTKAEVVNFEIESRFFSSDGTEISKMTYESKQWKPTFWKKVDYYSPEIQYMADDGQLYIGTWWTEMPGKLPYNIGEIIPIYYNPSRPGKFFLYDKIMMFWEPLLLVVIGTAGMIFMSFYLF